LEFSGAGSEPRSFDAFSCFCLRHRKQAEKIFDSETSSKARKTDINIRQGHTMLPVDKKIGTGIAEKNETCQKLEK
jgi:hypothetical protein